MSSNYEEMRQMLKNRKAEKLLPSPELYETEDYKKYIKTIEESQGYTVPKLPLSLKEGKYMPYIARFGNMDRLELYLDLAVAKFNTDNGTEYKLDHMIRGNYKLLGSGLLIYVTFKVKDLAEEAKESVELQARIYSTNANGVKVEECFTSRY